MPRHHGGLIKEALKLLKHHVQHCSNQENSTLEKYKSISFQSEWNIIVVTDFLLILNQMEFLLN